MSYAKDSRGLSPIRSLYCERRDTALLMADQGVQHLLLRIHRHDKRGIKTMYQTLPLFLRLTRTVSAQKYMMYMDCSCERLFELLHSNEVVTTYCTKGPAKASVLVLARVRRVSTRTVERGIRAAYERIARAEGPEVDSTMVASVVVWASGGVVPGDHFDAMPVWYGSPLPNNT